MQVTQINQHITHAVIGGSETIEFGISDNAEFFHMMSSTLYKDQILAVVREVLCNAWDAHIEANITDRPVQITLTHDKFVIRDFGKGIHRNDIGPIYGVYGNSTKKNDGKQTGGFGLGCKAPFAYTDHFEVQSSHAGVRTIYNMSKSNAQTMGKPGIIPIASFPTTESGLQVSIDILNQKDFFRFQCLIKRIVRNGDMNILLNDQPLDKLGFDANVSNYMVMTGGDLLDAHSQIMVRYGNVIYPVDKTGDLAELYTHVCNHLNSLGNNRYRSYSIIFQAPPHSITVQPSREGLSMQGKTVDTLKKLMEGFLNVLNTSFTVECNKFAKEIVKEAVENKKVGELLSTQKKLPYEGELTTAYRMTDLTSMAKQYMESNYPQTLAFRKQDIAYRLEQMVTAGLLDRGLVQTYLRHLEKVKSSHQMNREDNDWLQRHVIGRLVNKLCKTGIDPSRLYVLDPEDGNAPRTYYNKDIPPIVPFRQAQPKHLFMTMPYLRNIVVLSQSRTKLAERALADPILRNNGRYLGCLFYHLSPKKSDREAAIAFFEASGMSVVDLTEPLDTSVAARSTTRKPAKKGLPLLTHMKSLNAKSNHLNTRLILNDDAPRSENPEFIFLLSFARDQSSTALPGWDAVASSYIIDLFGDKGGAANNSMIHDKWLAKGVRKADEYIREKVVDFMLTNPNIQEYWKYEAGRAMDACNIGRYDSQELVKVVYRTPALRDVFGLVNNLTPEEKKMLYLWRQMDKDAHRYYKKPDDVIKVREHLNKIGLRMENHALLNKFHNNELLGIINESSLARLVKENQPGTPMGDKIISVLLSVLN